MHRKGVEKIVRQFVITAACTMMLVVCTFGQVLEKEIKLTWNNYKGRVPDKSHFAATTFSRVVIVTSKPVNGIIAQPVYVWCEFSETQSWVNRSLLSMSAHQRLLEHETNHYRLNIICAKRIKQSVSAYPSLTREKLDSITARFTRIFDERNKTYDKETRYGSYLAKQIAWEKQISSEMTGLKNVQLTRP